MIKKERRATITRFAGFQRIKSQGTVVNFNSL